MSTVRRRKALVFACFLGLLALALMVYSIIDPRPIPIVLAMSVAQGIGTLSFMIYGFVVFLDLRKAKILDIPTEDQPPEEPKP